MPIDSIKILPSKEIDKAKWNACVQENENGLIYARSFYLDAMAENWSGLVVGNYKAVMPLTWRKKFGIKYLTKEIFIQQLGLIGKLNEAETKTIIDFALKKFNLYGRITFNYSNEVSYLKSVKSCINFVLNLNQSYEAIFKNFVESLQRNIRKAIKNNIEIVDCSHLEAANAYKKYLLTVIDKNDIEVGFTRIEKLLQTISVENIISKKAIDIAGNSLATCLWLKDNKRIYNLMPATLPFGKDKAAMSLLLNNIIQQNCQQNLFFDFEGSELPGVRKFYEKFSPVNQPYFLYQYNRIPFLRRKM